MGNFVCLRIKLMLIVLVIFILVSDSCGLPNERRQYTDPEVETKTNSNSPFPYPTATIDETEFNRHFGKAVTLGNSNPQAAILEMEEALKINPNSKVAVKWIAEWYSILGNWTEEANSYRRWIKIDEDDMQAHGQLATLLIERLHQHREGLSEAKIAQSLCTGNTCYIFERKIAEAYEGLAKFQDAIDHYQKYEKGLKLDRNFIETSKTAEKISDLRNKLKKGKGDDRRGASPK
jgi:hypothetical protein